MSLSAAVFVLTDFLDKPLSNGQFFVDSGCLLATAVSSYLRILRKN